ncbi:adenine deaminase [Sediminitomix flava]|uniref:Adenine deaminase n=1 Tax=Sediminitomix flava TaxID=379075 RepID=A0A315ZB42_SEDFL|nr:adenine deaminase [Sediminitomix flava]PWJ42806.1 adenine deaminase [Sediminitomix flava]
MQKITANLIDIPKQSIYPAEVLFESGRIIEINELPENTELEGYIMPGFVDAHVHIESSMLVPSEFARLAVLHGTVATVSDPHEIANVNGIEGVEFMIENGKKVPLKFYFGAPSCVPATNFETAGANIGPDGIRQLLERDDIVYLAEMMNFPGVIYGDKEVHEKLAIAKELRKPIDGHAPQVRGEDLLKYIDVGISTDHECTTFDEAKEKIQNGMLVQIREGSAAKNYEALHALIDEYASRMMFCTDDMHPNQLIHGHLNKLVARAINDGHELFDVLNMACVNPVLHYNLNVGLLRENDPADFILVKDLTSFDVLQTYIDGELVAQEGQSFIKSVEVKPINKFYSYEVNASDFRIKPESKNLKVILAEDGQLITKAIQESALIENDNVISNSSEDILKLTVVNRYSKEKPAVAFIKGIGLKNGALASSIAHDSHNIIAVGADDESLAKAVNEIMNNQGGVTAFDGEKVHSLALGVAGLMTEADAFEVAKDYEAIVQKTKQLGVNLHDPFMTLSFMALLVIPELKLSDKGLFDGKSFQFTSVFDA